VVVGGGVLGSSIAARLSQTTATVCLLEAEPDLAGGASKSNAGVTVSFYGDPGSLETQIVNASSPRWEELSERLDVPFRRVGAIIVALTEDESDQLPALHERIAASGARARLFTSKQVRNRVALVSADCQGGISLPDDGIVDPMRLTIALAILADRNGAALQLGERVIGLRRDGASVVEVTTPARVVSARFVVNAAGLGAPEISALAGGEPLDGWPRKGQFVVLDRAFGSRLPHIVFSAPSADTKGIGVVPTTNGSALVGATAVDHTDISDRRTDHETIEVLLNHARRLVPSVDAKYAIKAYAGNRPASSEPFRLRFDRQVPNLIHATSRSSGVSAAPGAAEYVLGLLREAGLEANDNPNAVRSLTPVPRLRTANDPVALTSVDPRYGQVVCACEQVSAAEVAAALDGPIPATSIEGIRKRTGAAYGRCQGSLCLAGLSFLCGVATSAGPGRVRMTSSGAMGS
jgi:glycerol-3-phosphate dehydrogenase